jgi:hypothetical protein
MNGPFERLVGSGALVALVGDNMLGQLYATPEGRTAAAVVLGALGAALAGIVKALGDRVVEKIRGRRRKAPRTTETTATSEAPA